MAIIKIKNAAIDLDAAEIPNLPATKITSGTLDNARISLDAAEIPNLDTAKITTGTLADARVPSLNASKITAGTIATARLGSGTASSSTFLRGDNTFNTPPLGGITMADQWRVTTAFTGNANPIASNLEREDTAPALSYLGSQMTESSGVFTFPSTGIYMVQFFAGFKYNGDATYCSLYIKGTTNGSTGVQLAEANTYITRNSSTTTYTTAFVSSILDIQNTSNNKVMFQVDKEDTSVETLANTARTSTGFRFIRLGDT